VVRRGWARALQVADSLTRQRAPEMREADVIVNDNIKSFNGAVVLLPAVIDKNERVKIEVTA